MRTLAFVGSLDRAATYFGPPQGRGISVLAFDEATGGLTPLTENAETDNPTFLSLSADARTLYATSEVAQWIEGVVTAFRVDPATGALGYVNKQATQGSIAAHSTPDPSGKWLLVANYRMGEPGLRPAQSVVALPIEADGGLGPVAAGVAHAGSGPNVARQEGPHPHCALPTSDGRHVLVADLGIDRIVVYRFDAATGALERAGDVATPPGSGPRHLAWASDARLVATGELDSTVLSLAWDGAALRLTDVASTLPPGYGGDTTSAEIAVSADGRFVYASNRGHDSIAVLTIDSEGRLAPIGHLPTGRTPRNFALDPSGGFLLVACQDGHEITVHRRDAATGLLSDAVARLAVGSPMCVRVARVG